MNDRASFGYCRASNESLAQPSIWMPKEVGLAAGDRDQSVLGHINQLVKEEERLYAKGQLSEPD